MGKKAMTRPASTAMKAATVDYVSGLACSQAVLAAFSERYGLGRELALRLAAAFEGGTGMQGDVCGSLVGVYLILGLEYGGIDPNDLDAKQMTMQKVNEATRRFKECNGGKLTCRDLLEIDISTPEGLGQALSENSFRRHCPRFVRSAVQIVEELLNETTADPSAETKISEAVTE